MKCVQSLEEIKQNMLVLDNYLDEKHESEYSFALNLIKKGTCFIAVKTEIGYRFYPSRFIGYADNTMNRHLDNTEKDGKETNPAISKVLNQKVTYNKKLEKEYRDYCERLGFIANDKGAFGVERKYWEFYNEFRLDEKPRKQKNKKTKQLKEDKQKLLNGLYKNDCFWINLKGTCTRKKRGCTGSVNCELYVNRSQYIRENANN